MSFEFTYAPDRITLRLLPPLNIEQADLDSFVTTLEDILKTF